MKLLSQFSRRERVLLFITVGIIILAGLLNFLVIPVRKKWRRLNSQIVNLKTKLGRYAKIISLEQEIEARYNVYADYLKTKGSPEEALASVLQEIEKFARSSGVLLTNIVPSTLEVKDFYQKFEVRMEIEADISSLGRFLFELQKSKYLFRIVRLSIATKSGSKDTLRSSLQLLKVFIP
ncbi:MAG: type 4a pilus biogenesis protein PilO [Candidatus Omnitrophica bacterium]|nr:type 4a pilus biogenesis protein PilO [Candidatus Omnitrophota bacterium]MCM8798978.1 type 4a pilus biogenesis protein PilO [Candidatus Omnitrophota bacterium]